MSNDKIAAIEARWANWRPVVTKGVLQLIFEVPLEQTGAVLEYLGAPDQAHPVKAAIALLAKPDGVPFDAAPEKGRRFEDLPPTTQAAMRCADPVFINFLCCFNHAQAAIRVREQCGVESRSELNTNPQAAAKWRALNDAFEMHKRGMR